MTDKVIRIKNEYYIAAKSSYADDRTRVLKHGDTFAVFDRHGDVQPLGLGEQGLYHEGTRFLSRSALLINGTERPLLLSSNVKDDNVLLRVDLTTADLYDDGGHLIIRRGTVHLQRTKFLWNGVCYERLRVRNFGTEPIRIAFTIEWDVDFCDIFEVRGLTRPRRGRRSKPEVRGNQLLFSYRGLDRVTRRARVTCTPKPARWSESKMSFDLRLGAGRGVTYQLRVACEIQRGRRSRIKHPQALRMATKRLRVQEARYATIYTGNEQFNDWMGRSLSDLCLMGTETQHGTYPYAGVPWFNTAFGRDGLITALECLWINPDLAKGVLTYLAHTQATRRIAERDAEPGKIMHETRLGEMAALKEIPFGQYYGTIDATPLFVILAGAYYQRTADLSFLRRLWPHVERALNWIARYGDRDGDGFVEYARRKKTGLANQGWKDSEDSISHADGKLAEGPIALCEVQGYVYSAKRHAAGMARALGKPKHAASLILQAEALKRRFNKAFWSDSLSSFALALDGRQRPCKVLASNAGLCLYTGIATYPHAKRAAATLMGKAMFSGWGIRTLGTGEVRYNPMSYHNGSIWPHDTAMIAAGLSRYGDKDGALKLITGLLDASLFVDQHRLPELFCGFDQRPGEAPTLYPVACAPQAWASAAVFLLLQVCLGCSIRAPEGRILFYYPMLPEAVPRLQIKNLHVGKGIVDLSIRRHDLDVSVNVTRRVGDVAVDLIK